MSRYFQLAELRHLYAGCLLNGMGLPNEEALSCADEDLALLEELELIDFAAQALTLAAEDSSDDTLKQSLIQRIKELPGIKPIRVLGELTASNTEEHRMLYHGSRPSAVLNLAYQEYKDVLERKGYRVRGRVVDQSYQLRLWATWA
jgi:hypothetical protein